MANEEAIITAPRLVGEINSAGIAALKVDKSASHPPSAAGGIDTSRLSVLDHSGDDWSGTPSSVEDDEDYDALRLRPETTMEGSKGGGVEKEPTLSRSATVDTEETGTRVNGKTKTYEELRMDGPSSPKLMRKTSIQVTLEKTDKKGRYILTADDPTIREVLRRGFEREAAALDPKKPRTRFRDLVFTRQFTAFDRQNPLGSESPFRGFFTVFWLTIGLLLLKIAAQNYRVHGSVFGGKELLNMMFERDVIVLGLSDGAMVGITVVGLVLQKMVLKGYITWNGSGWIIQNIWQTFYLFAVVGWTQWREWPWTHTIFIVLHGIVFLMKQHSYAFYNGYLSQVYRRKGLLEEKLDQLDQIDPVSSPLASPTTSPGQQTPVASALDQSRMKSLNKRRRSVHKASTNLQAEQSEIAPIARAIEAGTPLDTEQLATFSSIIRAEIRSLEEELRGKCTITDNHYPKNLTLANWADWTTLPTLVYELEYPRTDKINWWYVAEKTAAVFGVIWVMMVISQAYIYPPVAETVRMKEAGMSLSERWLELPWIVSDILFPLLLEQLLSWYVIWECCLNVVAELTRFADRGFYGDWWNSRSWDQYARDWNRPVHTFLLRHVYHSSISALHLNKASATFVTFLLSALVHELVMWCLFKKFRGYLFCMQLAQIPLTMLGRSKLLKGRDTLNNVQFWLGMICGPALITSLYLIV